MLQGDTIKSIFKDYYNVSIGVFSFSLLLPIPIFNISLILLIIAFLLKLKENGFQKVFLVLKSPVFLGFGLLFLLQLTSLFYTSNLQDGLSVIERNTFLVFSPILLIFLNEKGFKGIVEKMFIYSCLTLLTIAYVIAFYEFINDISEISVLEKLKFHFTYQEFAGRIGHHAIYFTSYLILAFFLLLEEKNGSIVKFKKVVLSLFFISILLLKSVMLIAVFFIILFVYTVRVLKFNRTLNSLILSFFLFAGYLVLIIKLRQQFEVDYSLIMLLFALIVGFGTNFIIQKTKVNNAYLFFIPAIISVFGIMFLYIFNDENLMEIVLKNPSNVAYRYWNWTGAMSILKDNYLLGVGCGASGQLLVDYYKEYGFNNGVWFRYNEHNQYLRYWLEAGVLAFVIFIGLIYKLWINANKSKSIPFIVIVFTFVLFSITESTLGRHYGIVFFGFFFMYFNQKFNYESNQGRN